MAGHPKRGRKRKVAAIQESNHGGTGRRLPQMQPPAAFLLAPPPPPLPPPTQETESLPAKHRYLTRSSLGVLDQCANSKAPVRFPLRNKMGTPKQSYVAARRILLEADNVPCPAMEDIPSLEMCNAKFSQQNQVSTSPPNSSSYSSSCAKIDKSMKNAGNSVSSESAWSAPISKDEVDVEKFTANLLSQTERGENFHPLIPLSQYNENLTEKNLPKTDGNVALNVINEIPQMTATSCHSQRISQLSRSPSFSLTDIALLSNDDFLGDEVVESASDPVLVTLNGYRVKEEVAPLLRAIFVKYGDIAKDSMLQSSKSRALFLEMVCGIYQKLEKSRFVDITTFELNGLLNLIYDIECMKMDVKWLHQKIDEIFDAKRLIGKYSSLKEDKARNLDMISRKKEELVVLEQKRLLAVEELAAVENEVKEIDKRILHVKEKASEFHQKSLVHGLL